MTEEVFVDIMAHHFLPKAQKLFPQKDYILHQDNDPKHTSKMAREFLTNSDIIWVYLASKTLIKIIILKILNY
jgi:hypothetical protein